jgi:hypothetical protein
MARYPRSNKRFDQVFVIVRIDDPEQATPDLIDLMNRIAVTRAFWDEAAAEAEVQRLNALNGPKGAAYFSRLARLDRDTKHSGLE